MIKEESIMFCYGKLNEEGTWIESLTLEPLDEGFKTFDYNRDLVSPCSVYNAHFIGFDGSAEVLKSGLSLYFQMYTHDVGHWKIVVCGEDGFKIFRKMYNELQLAHAYVLCKAVDLLSIIDYVDENYYRNNHVIDSAFYMKEAWKVLKNEK